MATALAIFAVSHVALCGVRRVASTKAYRGSVSRLQMAGKKVSGTLPLSSLGSSLSRLGSGLARRAADGSGGGGDRSDSDKTGQGAEDIGAEAELGTVLAGVHALSATAAGLEAQLRQLVAAQAAAAAQAP